MDKVLAMIVFIFPYPISNASKMPTIFAYNYVIIPDQDQFVIAR